jgi:hypothetical protein
MYCHSCGIALTQQMKFCNRCGALLIKPETDLKRTEKRLDSYLEGLFWVTVFGLGIIFGGLIVLKKVDFEKWVLITYVCLSSTAFLINFGINLWGALKLMKSSKEIPAPESNTKELEAGSPMLLTPAPTPSVTENTTRSFEPVTTKRPDYDN